jgi:multidrug efflux pump subunit AcrA (membrane-fusion protein)
LILLGVLLVAGLVYQFGVKPRMEAQKQQAAGLAAIRTVKVPAGTFVQTLRISGVTSAPQFQNMTVPIQRGPESGRDLTLLYLAPSGTRVKKGQLVAEIDGQSLQDHIDDIGDTIGQAEADVRKRMAEQMLDMENLNQQIKLAKSEYDKAVLEAKSSEVKTVIDQELLKLAVEEAEANYKRSLADIAQKEIIHKAELKILEFTMERHRRHRGRHMNDLQRFKMFAPMDGLAVVQSLWRGREYTMIQQGDQIRPGTLFMKVVNPANMQIEANINQAESSLLRIGQEARIEYDAFPRLVQKGRIHSIGALATGGFRQQFYIRTVPVRVQIIDVHEKVIPDLSASADVTLKSEENAVRVPLGSVENADGKSFVWVKTGAGFERREIELGLRNNTHAVVSAGLKGGEDIAVDPQLARAL